MAIYYVDGDNGSDTNNGTSVETAWKTICKARDTMVAGDIVYIAYAVYREEIDLNSGNSGSSGNYIQYIGDYKGEIFGRKGYPRITGINNDYDTSATRNCGFVLTDTSKGYYKIKNLQIDNCGYRTISIEHSSTEWDAFVEIEGCILLNSPMLVSSAAKENINITRAKNITIRKNIIVSHKRGIYLGYDSTGEKNIIIENNILINSATNIDNDCAGIYLLSGNASIKHNTIIGGYYGIDVNSLSTSYPTIIKYNSISNSYYGIYADAENYLVISDWNFLSGNKTNFTNVTAGNNDKQEVPILFNWKDLNFLENSYAIDYITDANDTSTEDFFGNPRPLKGARDVGAIEYVPPSQKETTIKRTGDASLKLIKASFQDIKTFLKSGSHTISVYTRWSGYSGSNKPQLIVKQDKFCGINSDTIATATGDGTDWEQISVNITLSCDAEITIRLYSRDTGTNALTYFDDLEIT